MKKTLVLLALFLVAAFTANAENSNTSEETLVGKKKIQLGVSEADAEIHLQGRLVGKGSSEITVPSGGCVTVIVKKVGYLTEKIEFCNRRGMSKPPKTYYIEMKRDDSYDASIQTDIANVDIELVVNNMDKDTAWKLINQIVLS